MIIQKKLLINFSSHLFQGTESVWLLKNNATIALTILYINKKEEFQAYFSSII